MKNTDMHERNRHAFLRNMRNEQRNERVAGAILMAITIGFVVAIVLMLSMPRYN